MSEPAWKAKLKSRKSEGTLSTSSQQQQPSVSEEGGVAQSWKSKLKSNITAAPTNDDAPSENIPPTTVATSGINSPVKKWGVDKSTVPKWGTAVAVKPPTGTKVENKQPSSAAKRWGALRSNVVGANKADAPWRKPQPNSKTLGIAVPASSNRTSWSKANAASTQTVDEKTTEDIKNKEKEEASAVKPRWSVNKQLDTPQSERKKLDIAVPPSSNKISWNKANAAGTQPVDEKTAEDTKTKEKEEASAAKPRWSVNKKIETESSTNDTTATVSASSDSKSVPVADTAVAKPTSAAAKPTSAAAKPTSSTATTKRWSAGPRNEQAVSNRASWLKSDASDASVPEPATNDTSGSNQLKAPSSWGKSSKSTGASAEAPEEMIAPVNDTSGNNQSKASSWMKAQKSNTTSAEAEASQQQQGAITGSKATTATAAATATKTAKPKWGGTINANKTGGAVKVSSQSAAKKWETIRSNVVGSKKATAPWCKPKTEKPASIFGKTVNEKPANIFGKTIKRSKAEVPAWRKNLAKASTNTSSEPVGDTKAVAETKPKWQVNAGGSSKKWEATSDTKTGEGGPEEDAKKATTEIKPEWQVNAGGATKKFEAPKTDNAKEGDNKATPETNKAEEAADSIEAVFANTRSEINALEVSATRDDDQQSPEKPIDASTTEQSEGENTEASQPKGSQEEVSTEEKGVEAGSAEKESTGESPTEAVPAEAVSAEATSDAEVPPGEASAEAGQTKEEESTKEGSGEDGSSLEKEVSDKEAKPRKKKVVVKKKAEKPVAGTKKDMAAKTAAGEEVPRSQSKKLVKKRSSKKLKANDNNQQQNQPEKAAGEASAPPTSTKKKLVKKRVSAKKITSTEPGKARATPASPKKKVLKKKVAPVDSEKQTTTAAGENDAKVAPAAPKKKLVKTKVFTKKIATQPTGTATKVTGAPSSTNDNPRATVQKKMVKRKSVKKIVKVKTIKKIIPQPENVENKKQQPQTAQTATQQAATPQAAAVAATTKPKSKIASLDPFSMPFDADAAPPPDPVTKPVINPNSGATGAANNARAAQSTPGVTRISGGISTVNKSGEITSHSVVSRPGLVSNVAKTYKKSMPSANAGKSTPATVSAAPLKSPSSANASATASSTTAVKDSIGSNLNSSPSGSADAGAQTVKKPIMAGAGWVSGASAGLKKSTPINDSAKPAPTPSKIDWVAGARTSLKHTESPRKPPTSKIDWVTGARSSLKHFDIEKQPSEKSLKEGDKDHEWMQGLKHRRNSPATHDPDVLWL